MNSVLLYFLFFAAFVLSIPSITSDGSENLVFVTTGAAEVLANGVSIDKGIASPYVHKKGYPTMYGPFPEDGNLHWALNETFTGYGPTYCFLVFVRVYCSGGTAGYMQSSICKGIPPNFETCAFEGTTNYYPGSASLGGYGQSIEYSTIVDGGTDKILISGRCPNNGGTLTAGVSYNAIMLPSCRTVTL